MSNRAFTMAAVLLLATLLGALLTVELPKARHD